MKILVDKDIPYIYEIFGTTNQIQVCEGRSISTENLRDVDVLIIRSITRVNSILLCDSAVKFIGTVTSGVDHIDQVYLDKCDIKCVSACGSNAISVVEYVLASLFWLADRDRFFLRDKTVGIIGVGHIGNLLYHRLNNFGVHTILYDPYVSKINTDKPWKSLETLVSESDILTFHVPLTYTGNYPTWHMVNRDMLNALSSDKILINTSRGEIVDSVALLSILQSKKKMNVILDVWESEPQISLPLLSYVDIGTAHISGHSIEGKIRSIMTIYHEYCSYFNIQNRISPTSVLFDVINYIRVKNLDDMIINKLIKIVYNIYDDHIRLNYYASNERGFDALRKHYRFRRELSSLCVNTGKDYNDEILVNLGFSII